MKIKCVCGSEIEGNANDEQVWRFNINHDGRHAVEIIALQNKSQPIQAIEKELK